jgi:hypothetical protein
MVKKCLAIALLTVVVGCSDSTSPQDFNPTATQQKADAVLAALNGNLALKSLAALGGTIQLSVAQPALAAAPFDPTNPTTLQARLQALAAEPNFGTTAALALFPADLLGKTLVYDSTAGRYVVDSTRTDAPGTGIRIALYAVDPVLGHVVYPLNEIGYLDITDVSTPSADAVRLVAVVNGITYLDYVASAVRTTTTIGVSAEGYLSDGNSQVDFNLSATVGSSSVQLDYELSSGDNSVGLVATLQSDNNFTATLTIKGGSDTVVLEATVTTSTLNGQITYNGVQAVVISGTPDNPTFTRPDGTALTQDEIASLKAIGDIIGVVFDAFDNLLGPALVVFALG